MGCGGSAAVHAVDEPLKPPAAKEAPESPVAAAARAPEVPPPPPAVASRPPRSPLKIAARSPGCTCIAEDLKLELQEAVGAEKAAAALLPSADVAAETAEQGGETAAGGSAQVTHGGDDAGPGTAPVAGAEDSVSLGEGQQVRRSLGWCLRSRKRYLPGGTARGGGQQPSGALEVVMLEGVACVLGLELPDVPSRAEFQKDLVELWRICKTPVVKTVAMSRLRHLRTHFKVFQQGHSGAEADELRTFHVDLYSVMKVDNHIHLAAAMTPRLLLGFIREMFETEPEREVLPGKTLRTLVSEALRHNSRPAEWSSQSLESSGALSLEEVSKMLTIDSLRTVAGEHFYHRFDNFNDAYNPMGSGELRSVFLKSSNHIGGEYFGRLTARTLEGLAQNGTKAEMRLSIYGKDPREWDDLARWIKEHGLHEEKCTKWNLWMVQIPRVFGVFRKAGLVQSFDELLANIFTPLFEVTLDPSSHPVLAEVLPSIVAMDCVDDESRPDPLTVHRSQLYGSGFGPMAQEDPMQPAFWNIAENPPYSYYCYYLYANLRRLNDAAAALGRPWRLSFRPHAGEAGEVHHLATSFLLADGINHGVNLWHTPVLQYLYYIAQVGVSVAPISNNALFLKMGDSPFPYFFSRGLNVSLSTDDPLMFHTTNEPLLEEYTNARLVWGLSMTDLCEIAANSVRQSAFPSETKAAALGSQQGQGPYQWEPQCCNVPLRRLHFRRARLAEELDFLANGPPPLRQPAEPPGVQDWMRVTLP